MGGGLLLLVEVESHDVILLEVLDLPLLVDELALAVLHFLLADDPVVVDALPLLLEVRQQLLLLLVGLFQLAELLAHGKLNEDPSTLNYSDSVSFTLFASFTPCCYSPELTKLYEKGRARCLLEVASGAFSFKLYILKQKLNIINPNPRHLTPSSIPNLPSVDCSADSTSTPSLCSCSSPSAPSASCSSASS